MDHAAIECARCGMHLPLKRDLAADHQEAAWVCANCGWEMPGVLDPEARDTIVDNVAPIAPLAEIEIRRAEQFDADEPILSRIIAGMKLTPG
ncbi:hypothetical protein [Anatilimnocola floriformis]|uniref:hypothetical protein n=1 Tax=Anatilimnocola floriformis TaxID=2948575 RepID=UPI0020C2D44D|nr:hypothetical protein [Anatilimnocola floriformis]